VQLGLVTRRRQGVLVVKLVGAVGQCEVLIGPLVRTTMEWVFEEVIAAGYGMVLSGDWNGTLELVEFLTRGPDCMRACGGVCSCVEQELWDAVGWRRAAAPELDLAKLPLWWTGVCDAVGTLGEGGKLWMQCPCCGRDWM
jgi:hypothetical protein